MAVMGRGLQCAVPVGTVNAHTVSLLSSSPPHAATAAAAFSSQASLSHSWIFAVASEFVCFFPLVLASLVRIRDGGPWPFPSALEHIPSPRHCEAH